MHDLTPWISGRSLCLSVVHNLPLSAPDGDIDSKHGVASDHGHFLPEEDDKFLERVQAAVEEEERQTMAAADKDAAKEAIATAVECRKIIQGHGPDSKVPITRALGSTTTSGRCNMGILPGATKVRVNFRVLPLFGS
ncbi:hypothetical protein RHGRI_001747 [Rhododendron griersonianum]|uniref:Uncharacterized protein n=1 Tax=Rhododendron griersonianum TaxID=479676 RepID=A0AAV6LLW6_9ERIC|nr:hypothetical protein RHGRI_001747 [Rhododendron griersonianum]